VFPVAWDLRPAACQSRNVSSPRFNHILALLHDAHTLSAVVDEAVAIAIQDRARLTLAKMTHTSWLCRYSCPLPGIPVPAVTESDLQAAAEAGLARALRLIPKLFLSRVC
jgi:hypothetical protein